MKDRGLQNMYGVCRLYDDYCELKESHVLPKFIIDYFKKTGSSYLRAAVEPNRRRQDGKKGYYLSGRAELDFSKREKWFAEKIFKPFLEEKRRLLEYDENLYYFLISLLWRGLLSELENPDYVKEKCYETLLEVEREWKNYLRGGVSPVKFPDINLFLTDSIRAHSINATGLDYYFTRTLDFTVFASSDGSFVAVYCKFLRFMVWSVIKDIHTNINSELQIRSSQGFIHFPQHIHDAYMIENVIQRVRVIESMPGASKQQQEKIFQEAKKNTEKFGSTDAARAIFTDWYNLDQS